MYQVGRHWHGARLLHSPRSSSSQLKRLTVPAESFFARTSGAEPMQAAAFTSVF